MHPERAAQTRALESLDPETDYEIIYRRSIFDAYNRTGRLAYELAFVRTLAIPSIARLMTDTGVTRRDPEKRSMDTGLVMFEIIYGGLESDRARRMIRLINRAHNGLPLRPDDNTYTLSMFMCGAYQWLDRFGWRPSLPVEREAAHRFYVQLGRRLRVADIPESYTAAERFIAHHEARHLTPTVEARELVGLTLPVYSDHLPALLRPLGPNLVAALVDNPRTSEAMGLHCPAPLAIAIRSALKAKAAADARRPVEEVWFTPGGGLRDSLYQDGYDLCDLGPEVDRDALRMPIVTR